MEGLLFFHSIGGDLVLVRQSSEVVGADGSDAIAVVIYFYQLSLLF
jgi:hypothetical protein